MFLTPANEKALSHGLLDVLIRAGLIAVLVVASWQVFHPFLDLMIWAVILAVTLYPLHARLKRRLGNKDGRAATLLVLISIALIMVPVYLLGLSLAASVGDAVEVARSGSIHVPPPADSVAEWPLVGERVHATLVAGIDRPDQPGSEVRAADQGVQPDRARQDGRSRRRHPAVHRSPDHRRHPHGLRRHRPTQRGGDRLAHLRTGAWANIVTLCTATIRAVAQGVIGIAFIQMLLVGIGFVLMGVPAAGVLSLIVLLLGIMQMPATLVTLPVIAFVIATMGVSASTIIFSVYVFVAGLIDNVLKPLMLGRGVDVPMPVILIGALGGMVTDGIIGLFIGPVILAVGYQLFWLWVEEQTPLAAPVVPDVPAQPAQS